MAEARWATQGSSGLAQAYLTKWLRHYSQPLMRFRDVCDMREAIGKGAGDTYNWTKVANVTTGGTYTGISEASVMPQDEFTVSKGTGTITEYGNAIPFSRKLLELSQHDLKQIVRTSLANDMAKTMDRAIFAELAKSLLICGPSSGGSLTAVETSTNGTRATAHAGTAPLNTAHLVQIVDIMKEKNIPTFDGEDYVCIAHPTTLQNLRTQMMAINQYTETGYKKILSGEIGRYGGVRFVEQTNVAKVTPTNTGAGSWAVFLGGEAIIQAVSVPEEIVIKEITDYGRSLGLGWYTICGFKLAWGDVAADNANARVMWWWPNATSPTSLTP